MIIEVAYALPDEQFLSEESVEEGTTVGEALKVSKLLKKFPDLNIDSVGIFSQEVSLDRVLREGDRIEVYRPLIANPRERRRKQVEEDRKQK
ncbi:MAG: RnfH family protein [Piscirickettsiaceae bacterium CG_4_9_14_3_um_filter_43_564]|nr:RnfH family protein [Thiomicrospira sp.]OIP96619.1 MAG: RnfH family protein [Thiomicrospira sp. CG2_30_44_34]PIQ06486.1 MAG: RnfH family protein [Piscirickettsiaceae bacterium CG18_big_fil_WC_8_21_14_2_50_44_103]PIU39181.1 MAG: RnfH family protein [Piscirickettsiaceae bacterium CG07_land_8_20_14_0_80_44_28]PIW78054.1 MAG: RnfH family protein [Piscirickettsiaceae bacterium CG_4_8_14_3_um_filter_44_38]PIX78708.1 MAG: RnfH family protein [Piscirickettsiaceae bacterium CG_4_10_14_3_um_filter_44